MKRIILNVISIAVIVYCVYSYITFKQVDINLNSNKMYYLNSYSTSIVEREDSENIIKCDLSAASNAINAIIDDGFRIEKEEYTSKYFDVILTKDDEIYRIHYTNDGIFTSIARPYKNSSTPVTYIDDKKK